MLIGATSWQICGSYLKNIEDMGENIQFCELLVYTWNKNTEKILSKEIDEIQKRIKMSVHLPTDKFEHVKSAYEFFKAYDFINMTLHPFTNFKQFSDFYFRISEKESGKKISIENPENDIFFEFCDYLKDETSNILITMDYGHLLLDNRSIHGFYRRFSEQISEIHFHGANKKKSHCYPEEKTIKSFKQFLEEKKLDRVIKNLRQPVLGICLGLQLMCEFSEENHTDCLNLFPAKVKRFNTNLKIPHVGWNQIYNLRSPLFEGIEEGSFVYFVHSYFAELNQHTIAETEYGNRFSAAIQFNNFTATQFHPERSGKNGERILKNFLEL